MWTEVVCYFLAHFCEGGVHDCGDEGHAAAAACSCFCACFYFADGFAFTFFDDAGDVTFADVVAGADLGFVVPVKS